MRRLLAVICLCMVTLPALCESGSKYQVGTIMEVKPQQTGKADTSEVTSYEISIKAGETVYTVLYTPPLGQPSVKYFAGRDLLVLVGEKTIKYNDILGQSFEVPILRQRTEVKTAQSK